MEAILSPSWVLTTDHAASSYGQAVLLIEGEPVGVLEASLGQYEIITATGEEIEALEQAGYTFEF
jgi:hypothetical protein